MNPKVLLVDDEKNILEAYKRNLRDHFEVTTAGSGEEALKILANGDVFPVIVTDYKMPGMNGVQLLEAARDVSPDTVQIMLTGQAEMQAVIDLINKGRIFRFLTKPCLENDLINNIKVAVRQHELITAERELLGKTLGGTVKVLIDLLALAKPQAFHRAQRIRNLTKRIADYNKMKDSWQMEIASTLSQIGCVTIPDEILKKAYGGRMLTDYELDIFQNHPLVAADMIGTIPRMDKVSEIIRYQEKLYNGSGVPDDGVKGEAIPLGSRIIKIATDFENQVNAGLEQEKVLSIMKKKDGWYDPPLLEIAAKAFMEISAKGKRFVNRECSIEMLNDDLYLAEDIVSAEGVILGSKNQKITAVLKMTLKNYEKNKQIRNTIKVIAPVD